MANFNKTMSESIFKAPEPTKEKRVPTKEDFTYVNIVNLCGKILKVYPSGKGYLFLLSCGRFKEVKNKDGLILRNIIGVYFYGKEGEYYKEHFSPGEFVAVNGVAQTKIAFEESHTEIWGISMVSKYNKNRKPIHDMNYVNIRGKIDRSVVINDNYILLNVYTITDKSHRNLNKESEIKKLTTTYKSITPIGIHCRGNAKELIKQYTKGTWVNCKGFVDDKAYMVNNKRKKKMHIIAFDTEVIGQTQIVQ